MPEPRIPASRPNILLIITDEQYAGAMSVTGNSDLSTPALDALARQSTRFTEVYCTYPSSAPSRASLFTGLMPHQTGVYDNHPDMTLNDACVKQTLGLLLRYAGYDCLYGGKWHLQDHSIPDKVHGFENICPINDIELPGRCAKALAVKRDKPFFMVASFDNPHNILEAARDVAQPWGNVEKAPLDQCPNLPANFAQMPYEPEAVIAERDRFPIAFRAPYYSPDDWRQYRHLYYRLVEKVDAQIGKLLQAVKDTGHERDTVVIFTSDHGDALGAHQWNQKWVLYEESVRVPLIVRDPFGGADNAVNQTHLVSNGPDLYATVCDYAGVDMPAGRSGRSLRRIVRGDAPGSWRDHLVSETWWGVIFPHSLKTHGRMVRTQDHKYICYSWGKYREQLFDLRNDPGEMVNLAVESRHADLLQRHRDLLAAHMVATDDRFQKHYAHPDVLPRLPGQSYL